MPETAAAALTEPIVTENAAEVTNRNGLDDSCGPFAFHSGAAGAR